MRNNCVLQNINNVNKYYNLKTVLGVGFTFWELIHTPFLFFCFSNAIHHNTKIFFFLLENQCTISSVFVGDVKKAKQQQIKGKILNNFLRQILLQSMNSIEHSM